MTDTQAAINVINQMEEKGVIGKYAIGGAVAAAFYIEPTTTYDLDIFISFDNVPQTSLVSLEPIFTYLQSLHYEVRGEYVVLEGWQVQFLPAGDVLYREALDESLETKIGDIRTRVMTPEHLMAIALRLGRAKDLIRLKLFVELKAYEAGKLNQILERHKLFEKWKQFNEKYNRGSNE
jgi:hypothetical protein